MTARRSIASRNSVLSIGSVESFCSIGSARSAFSIGSVNSFASLGSLASAMSILSTGSFQSRASLLSGQSDRSVFSWQSQGAMRAERESGDRGAVFPAAVTLVVGAAVAALWWRVGARRRC